MSRVFSSSMAGVRDAPTLLWVELELANDDVLPWLLRAADVRLGDKRAAGFAHRPLVQHDAVVAPEVNVDAGRSRRIWLRFDGVDMQDAAAARAGVDVPVALALELPTASDPLALPLSDPMHGTPTWIARDQPGFMTLQFGYALAFDSLSKMNTGKVGLGLDIGLSLQRRFGEVDVGLAGVMRAGMAAARVGATDTITRSAMFAFAGGGPTLGYTLTGQRVYLRASLDSAIGLGSVDDAETAALLLGPQLQLGAMRRTLYPFRERRTNATLGIYLRGDTRLTSFRKLDGPFDYAVTTGLFMRLGS